MTSENGCSGSTEDVVILVEELFYLRFFSASAVAWSLGGTGKHTKRWFIVSS